MTASISMDKTLAKAISKLKINFNSLWENDGVYLIPSKEKNTRILMTNGHWIIDMVSSSCNVEKPVKLSEQNLKDLVYGIKTVENNEEFEMEEINKITDLMETWAWNLPSKDKNNAHERDKGINSKYMEMIGTFFNTLYVNKHIPFICISYEIDTMIGCYNFWTTAYHNSIISLNFYLYPCMINA